MNKIIILPIPVFKIRAVTFMLFLACFICSGGSLVQFRSVFGTIDVELYDTEKPVTVQNFLRYVDSGTYVNMFYHRWLPGFVMQGGGLRIETINGQPFITSVPPFPAITNEYSVGKPFSNVFGTLAMARVSRQTNSATSEWFFNLNNNSFLDDVDGGFTVFGRVISGTNLLLNFNNPQYFKKGTIGGHTDVPLLRTNFTVADLVYVDITSLKVAVRPQTNGMQISFNTIQGRTNLVEFTTQYPPAWQSLTNVVGTGARVSVTDTNLSATNRFYRVRIDYPGLPPS